MSNLDTCDLIERRARAIYFGSIGITYGVVTSLPTLFAECYGSNPGMFCSFFSTILNFPSLFFVLLFESGLQSALFSGFWVFTITLAGNAVIFATIGYYVPVKKTVIKNRVYTNYLLPWITWVLLLVLSPLFFYILNNV